MDENFYDLIRQKQNREKNYKESLGNSSKDRFNKIAKKKIQTTMIGALDVVEKEFGFLWGHGSEDDLTPEQKHMRDVYENVRQTILDNGNNQIRNLESEVSQYHVEWRGYSYQIPVKPAE